MIYPDKFFIIAGPCAIESHEICFEVATELMQISLSLGIEIIYKASYDKANRSSILSGRGVGIGEGLKVLKDIKDQFGFGILTDVHNVCDIERVSKVADILQIPAFLCRQTDFYIEAGRRNIPINVKKGQFANAGTMFKALGKYVESGGFPSQFSVTERGTFFGYDDLVVDFRSILDIKESGIRYIYDAGHSVQIPEKGVESGGSKRYLEHLAFCQVRAGCDGVFIETHPNPENAISDKDTQYPLYSIKKFIKRLKELNERYFSEDKKL